MCKQSYEKASNALVTISTLSREVAYQDIKELVRAVLQCPTTRSSLPVLIMFMRNHSKSLAPGVGCGEKSVPLKLLCALHEEDPHIATALLKDLALYGSWASLLHLLAYTDMLALEAVENYHPSSPHQFTALQKAVYHRFSEQLKADKTADENVSGVSNASKFTPHEGRGGFNNYHGDQVAELIFSGVAVHLSPDARKHTLRKMYRQLRTRLNSSNGHIAEASAIRRCPVLLCALLPS
jgi:hypothetical protein